MVLERSVGFHKTVAPQPGLVITDEDQEHFVVRDGMVVDAKFMATDVETKKGVVDKHKNHLTFYIHAFPVPKNGPTAPLTFGALEDLRKQANFNDNVSF